MVLDSKYLSNLNDINKSEQKSNVDTSKGFGWPTEGEAGIGKFILDNQETKVLQKKIMIKNVAFIFKRNYFFGYK